MMQRRTRFIAVLVAAILGVTMAPITAPALAAVSYSSDDDGSYADDPTFNYNCGVDDNLWWPRAGVPYAKEQTLHFFSNVAKANGNKWYGKKPTSTTAGNPTYYIAFLKNDKTGLKPSDAGYKNPVFKYGPDYAKEDINLVSTDNGQFGIQPKRINAFFINYNVVDKSGRWCYQANTNGGMESAELPMVEVNRNGVVIENKAGYGRKRDRIGGPVNGGTTEDLWITFRSLRSGKPYTATVKVKGEHRERIKLPKKLAKIAEEYGWIEWQASFYPPGLQRSRQVGTPATLTYENPTWFTVKWTPKAKESVSWMTTRAPLLRVTEGSSPSPVKAEPVKPRAILSVKKRKTATVKLINKTSKTVQYKLRYRKASTSSYRTIVRSVKPKATRVVTLRIVKGSVVKVWYKKKTGAYTRLINERS